MFVFPMVGQSSRFFKQGYTVPKYQLPLGDATVFHRVVASFSEYFQSDCFRFLCRSDFDAPAFIENELRNLGVKRYSIEVFESDTRGQAETVYQGVRDIDLEEEIYIFNIDTIRPGFRKAEFPEPVDGYLEVFSAEGDHWSFVLPGEDGCVRATTEKVRVSDYCSDGLYYFKRKSDFDSAFEDAVRKQNTCKGEFYVAPMYNNLIAEGKRIKYVQVAPEEVILCGTPAEYEALRSK